MQNTEKKTFVLKSVAVDFDGVIYPKYDGVTPNKDKQPIDGAIEAISDLKEIGFEPFILTARPDHELPAVKEYIEYWASLIAQDFSWLLVTNIKLPAIMYIDDRAYRFNGWKDAIALFPFHVANDWNKPKE
jgi:ribonucleotide monophosphatase NagD (HAD superfamily)